MNYRILFFISILILSIGVAGLFFLPVEEESQSNEATPQTQEQPKIAEVVITTAVANRNIPKGILLQAEDYTLNELKVEENSPLVSSDLKQLIESSDSKTLQGFLTSENLTEGSIISANNILSPNDSEFIISSLNPKQEVAYRIYLQDSEQYILDTLRQGDSVSVFSQQLDHNKLAAEKKQLIKLLDNLTVLQVKKVQVEGAKEDGSSLSSENNNKKGYVGYLSIKVNAKQVQQLYSLENNVKLIVLPSHQAEETNRRGSFIRALRGQ